MKKIAIIMSPTLPVPAVKGGAIETLIDEIISENEIEQKVLLEIYCVYDKDAERLSKKYKFTNIHYIDNFGIINKMLYFCFRILRKLFRVRPLFLDKYHRQITSLIKQNRPDLCIIEGGAYIYEYRKISDYLGKEKMVIHLHAVFEAMPRTDEIFGSAIAISQYVADVWNASTEMHTSVLKNAINSELFLRDIQSDSNFRLEYGIKDSSIVFLYIGRIVEVKGVRELCQAFMDIPEKNLCLCIVGKDDSRTGADSSYFKEIKKYSVIDQRILLLGYIPNAELPSIYRMADAMIIPSMWEEGAGLVVQEGMVSGLPLIVTDSGGMAEYTCPEGTIVVHRNTIHDDLKNAIIQLKDNEIRRKMGMKNKEYAMQYCSSKYYKDFVNLVEEQIINSGKEQ